MKQIYTAGVTTQPLHAYLKSDQGTITTTFTGTVEITSPKSTSAQPDFTNGHDYVEIAGIKWATVNIGAEKATDEGLHFQWGDVSDSSTSSLDRYKYYDSTLRATSGYTKYNLIDGLDTLMAEDDAASVNWGGNWRTPSPTEVLTLIENTTWEVRTIDEKTCTVLADKQDPSKQLVFVNSFGDTKIMTNAVAGDPRNKCKIGIIYDERGYDPNILDLDRYLRYPIRAVLGDGSADVSQSYNTSDPNANVVTNTVSSYKFGDFYYLICRMSDNTVRILTTDDGEFPYSTNKAEFALDYTGFDPGTSSNVPTFATVVENNPSDLQTAVCKLEFDGQPTKDDWALRLYVNNMAAAIGTPEILSGGDIGSLYIV